jgi:hypothetical protein
MTRLLRWCAYVVLAVLLAVVGVYLVVGLHGRAELEDAKDHAVSDVRDALPEGRRQATRARGVVLSTSKWTAPAYTWRELVCALNHTEGGLMIQDYYQECRIRSVDMFATHGATPPAPASGTCAPTTIPGLDELEQGASQEPTAAPLPFDPHNAQAWAATSAVLVEAAARASGSSAVQVTASCPDGILTPPAAGRSRLLDGARPQHLDAGVSWTVLVIETPLTHSRLGCNPWALVFCSAPVDAPVVPVVG